MKTLNIRSNEIKERIVFGLKKKFDSQGFVYKKASNTFICEQGDLKYFFILEQHSWSDHFSITVNLAISHKKIESQLQQILGKTRHSYTLYQDIAKVYKSPDGKEIINGNLVILLIYEEDIEAAIETLYNYYDEIAISYFSKFNTIEDFDKIINNPPFDHSPAYVGGSLDYRCMKGLIVASMVHNIQKNELVNIYNTAILRTMNEEAINNYCKVRDFVLKNSLN